MACQGDVEGYLQLTDHIIQQIKWAEVRSDQCQGKEDSKKDLKKDLKEVSTLSISTINPELNKYFNKLRNHHFNEILQSPS